MKTKVYFAFNPVKTKVESASFILLLQLIAHRAGRLINYNELAQLTLLSVPTVKNYLCYAEKTFLIAPVTPYFTNKGKELVKSPQYYFLDHGLRNFLTGLVHENAASEQDQGFRFQQMIYQLLAEKTQNASASLHYWRTQNQAEVDFVIDTGHGLLPIEVKSGFLKSPQIERSMHSFIDQYQPKEAWVVNRTLSESVKMKGTTVRFMPWFKLLENNF